MGKTLCKNPLFPAVFVLITTMTHLPWSLPRRRNYSLTLSWTAACLIQANRRVVTTCSLLENACDFLIMMVVLTFHNLLISNNGVWDRWCGHLKSCVCCRYWDGFLCHSFAAWGFVPDPDYRFLLSISWRSLYDGKYCVTNQKHVVFAMLVQLHTYFSVTH